MNQNKSFKRTSFLIYTLTIFLLIEAKAQHIDFNDFPEEVVRNIESLVSMKKTKSYDPLIGIAERYKDENPEFGYVFDMFIIDAYFELRYFDKVIEYTEPYMKNEKFLLLGKGDFEIYLGQAYIQKERIKEGCALLKNVKIDDPQFTIAYVSNCFDFKEYVFSVPGNQLNTPSDLLVKEGDVIRFNASGRVRFGTFAGFSGPEGFTNGMFRNYNRTQ